MKNLWLKGNNPILLIYIISLNIIFSYIYLESSISFLSVTWGFSLSQKLQTLIKEFFFKKKTHLIKILRENICVSQKVIVDTKQALLKCLSTEFQENKWPQTILL